MVFGIPMSRGVLSSPDYNLYFLHAAYHTIYNRLDEISANLCNFIESESGSRAVPVPSYAPLVFHEFEPWGIISLKHAAVKAGLGAFGRSGQMYNPQFGSLLRLGAVITSAEMPGDPLEEEMPCPDNCSLCHRKCPPGAFGENGRFDKMNCLGHTIKHAVYPLALKDEAGLAHIERVINTAGYNYWLACNECLKVCPLNRKGMASKTSVSEAAG